MLSEDQANAHIVQLIREFNTASAEEDRTDTLHAEASARLEAARDKLTTAMADYDKTFNGSFAFAFEGQSWNRYQDCMGKPNVYPSKIVTLTD